MSRPCRVSPSVGASNPCIQLGEGKRRKKWSDGRKRRKELVSFRFVSKRKKRENGHSSPLCPVRFSSSISSDYRSFSIAHAHCSPRDPHFNDAHTLFGARWPRTRNARSRRQGREKATAEFNGEISRVRPLIWITSTPIPSSPRRNVPISSLITLRPRLSYWLLARVLQADFFLRPPLCLIFSPRFFSAVAF